MALNRVATASAFVAVFCGLSTGPSRVLRAAPPAGGAVQLSVAAEHQAVLDRYCVGCHNARTKTGGLSLDGVNLNAVDRHADLFEKVVRKLRTREMPPAGSPRPDIATYDAFAGSLEGGIGPRSESAA